MGLNARYQCGFDDVLKSAPCQRAPFFGGLCERFLHIRGNVVAKRLGDSRVKQRHRLPIALLVIGGFNKIAAEAPTTLSLLDLKRGLARTTVRVERADVSVA